MPMFNNIDQVHELTKITGMEAERKRRRMTVEQFYAVPRDPPSASALPIFDSSHVRNAMARFNQTKMSPQERRRAFNKVIRAASKHGINSSAFKSKHEKRLHEKLDNTRINMVKSDADVFSV